MAVAVATAGACEILKKNDCGGKQKLLYFKANFKLRISYKVKFKIC